MSNIRIHVTKHGKHSDIAVIELYGAIDTVASYTFQDKMQGLMQTGLHKYIIDLQHLKYISSAGLETLHMMAQRLHPRQGRIILVQVPKKIYKVFDIIGITTFFYIKDSVQEALQELDKNATVYEQ